MAAGDSKHCRVGNMMTFIIAEWGVGWQPETVIIEEWGAGAGWQQGRVIIAEWGVV